MRWTVELAGLCVWGRIAGILCLGRLREGRSSSVSYFPRFGILPSLRMGSRSKGSGPKRIWHFGKFVHHGLAQPW